MGMPEDIAKNANDITGLKAQITALTSRLAAAEENVAANTARIDEAAQAALQRTENVETWLQAYEEGPMGNVPWADRPIPPPISHPVAEKRMEARRREGKSRKEK